MTNTYLTRKCLLVLPIFIWLNFGSAYTNASSDHGNFEGEICTRWNESDNRSMTLCAPFAFVDPEGLRLDVPDGTVVDGASIPKAFWSIIGGPFEGSYRNASVVHDYYCVTKSRPWQAVHRMFYDGMLAAGTATVKAKVMYYAVLVGGPRWKEVLYTNHAPRAFAKPGDIDEMRLVPWNVDFNEMTAKQDAEWIEGNNPSLEEIEARANSAFSGSEPKDRIRIDRQ